MSLLKRVRPVVPLQPGTRLHPADGFQTSGWPQDHSRIAERLSPPRDDGGGALMTSGNALISGAGAVPLQEPSNWPKSTVQSAVTKPPSPSFSGQIAL